MKSRVVPLFILSALVACPLVAPPSEAQTSGRKTATANRRAPTRARVGEDPFNPYAGVAGSFTPLMRASMRGDLKAVRALLKRGAKVDQSHHAGITALMIAVERGHLPVVRELLRAGADPDHRAMTPHAGQVSALAWAITSNHDTPFKMDLIEALLDAGADVNPAPGPGLTPLMFAVMPGGDVRVVELLLAKGADVNAAYPANGYTALMGAAAEGTGEMVSALIKAGADLHAKNRFGETALSIAIRHGYGANERLLRLAGAKY